MSDKIYPINYDFGKNWNEQIVPHLNNPKLKRKIKQGINDFVHNNLSLMYEPRSVPASYTSSDAYACLIDRIQEKYLEKLEENDLLPKKYIRLHNKLQELDDNHFVEYMDYKDKICKKVTDWHYVRNNIESYVVYHACHFWNPTFGLTLAKLVLPEEKWKVRSSDKHTTIINEEETKIFDIIYWACNYLENHLFGDTLSEIVLADITLNGKNAYLDSS